MTSFAISTNTLQTGSDYVLIGGDIGTITAGATLTQALAFAWPLGWGGGAPLIQLGYSAGFPIWVNLQGNLVSLAAAIGDWTLYIPDLPPTFRTAMITVGAGASISQAGASAGLASDAAINLAASNGLTIVNQGAISGDTGIKSHTMATGDYVFGLMGTPYHWDSTGVTIANAGTIMGLNGAAIEISGNGLGALTNSGAITGQGVSAAYLGAGGTDVVSNLGSMVGNAAGFAILTRLGNDSVNNQGTVTGGVDMGDGNDVLTNSGQISGAVLLGLGDDTYTGTGNGQTGGTISGGTGNDTLIGSDFAAGDKLSGDAGNDSLVGNLGNDSIYGGVGNDQLSGGAGNDNLYGGTGTDIILADHGADFLNGGGGVDSLTGGMGNDHFVYGALGEAGDTINDFSNVAGDNDNIYISAATFGAGLVVGVLATGKFQIRADNIAQDADDRFIFRTTDTTLWFDNNGNAAGGLTMIADLQVGATATFMDILIY